MVKVGVIGAGGRMGVAVCNAINNDSELELVAGIDPARAGSEIELNNASVTLSHKAELSALVEAGADVAVDFTHLEVALTNAEYCAANGIHMVIGTSGFKDDEIAKLDSLFNSSNCVVVPNFSISAVLLKHLSKIAAPFFETAEVIELHHDGKKDAPSGTAIDLATAIDEAGSDWAQDPTEVEILPSSRGAKVGSVPIHAVRMRGMVGHQEVIMGEVGQTLTLRQDSYDRSSFMPGVVLACKKVGSSEGVSLGLESFLGLE